MLVHKGGKIKNWVVTPTKLQSQNIFKEHWERRVGGGGGVRMVVNEELTFVKIHFFFFFGGGGASGRGLG